MILNLHAQEGEEVAGVTVGDGGGAFEGLNKNDFDPRINSQSMWRTKQDHFRHRRAPSGGGGHQDGAGAASGARGSARTHTHALVCGQEGDRRPASSPSQRRAGKDHREAFLRCGGTTGPSLNEQRGSRDTEQQ